MVISIEIYPRCAIFNLIIIFALNQGQVIIYTAYNVLTKTHHKAGYALLCAIRKYLECDMYMGYEVHTEQTLHELQSCMVQFGDLLQVC